MEFSSLNRRRFLAATGAALAGSRRASAADSADLKPLFAEADKRHDEAVQRLQHWIQQPSIAAENRGMTEGCDLMMSMLRDAGFGGRDEGPDCRPSRRVRHPGRRRASHCRNLFHVRREAG